MNDITNVPNPNITPDYSAITSAPKPTQQVQQERSQLQTESSEIDINELVQNDPEYREIFQRASTLFNGASNEERFSIYSLLGSLLQLSETLQTIATTQAFHLEKLSKLMKGYAELQKQVPVLTQEVKFDNDASRDNQLRSEYNQKFSNALEMVRAMKGRAEDQAKKSQTFTQQLKDDSSKTSDFFGTFLNLLNGIGKKISQ